MRRLCLEIYKRMYVHFGPRNWWPAKTPFEVMVGAILTQNAAWTNVEKAISNLRKRRILSPHKLSRISLSTLQDLIRPSGFYKEKAKRLKSFVKFLLGICNGKPSRLRFYETKRLREMLLNIKGIGPETADSILLYALGRTIFVVDAYTRRIFARHKLIDKKATYEQIQRFFMKNLPTDLKLFNEYHALIVETGKNYCRKKKPLCKICPLRVVKMSRDMV